MTRKRTPHLAFAAWLREQLAARGWSAADLAARVGVRPTSVYYWTAGRATPLDPQVAAIAAALAVEPADVWAVLARDGVTPFGGPATPRPVRAPAVPRARPDRPFARWLRAALDERRLSRGQVAKLLDVDTTTVQRWANGVGTPASVHLPGLAAALDVDPATIRELIDRADAEDSAQH